MGLFTRTLHKGKKAAIGAVKTHTDGYTYKKVAEGKWERVKGKGLKWGRESARYPGRRATASQEARAANGGHYSLGRSGKYHTVRYHPPDEDEPSKHVGQHTTVSGAKAMAHSHHGGHHE